MPGRRSRLKALLFRRHGLRPLERQALDLGTYSHPSATTHHERMEAAERRRDRRAQRPTSCRSLESFIPRRIRLPHRIPSPGHPTYVPRLGRPLRLITVRLYDQVYKVASRHLVLAIRLGWYPATRSVYKRAYGRGQAPRVLRVA